MDTKIVFIVNKRKFFGILTRIFTGCHCYHCGILIGDNFYDVSWRRRRSEWSPESYPNAKVIVFDSPIEIDEKILINKMMSSKETYGILNYFLYAIKPFFRALKIPMWNMGGIICSEQVNEDLIDAGWHSPWEKKRHPPSPCKMLSYFANHYNYKYDNNER